jgi:hypothetical protein
MIRPRPGGKLIGMRRTIFVVYLAGVVAGLLFFIAVGVLNGGGG